jgi:hypothetical protein
MSIQLTPRLRLLTERGSPRGLTLMHWCPGCNARHVIEVEKPNFCNAVWKWNEDALKPTVTPSVNIVGQCHYFLTDGQLVFCGDSKHALAGQTVELPVFPQAKSIDNWGVYGADDREPA